MAALIRLNPPANEQPLAPDGQHTQAWTAYHQEVADQIASALTSIANKAGVVDGSDADAGQLGEVLTASASGVTLGSGAAVNVATLALPAGDFDVWGAVKFTPASGTTSSHLYVAIGTAHQELFMAIPAGTGAASLSLGTGTPMRFNSGTAQTATLVALASHSGSMTADAVITARRAR